MILPLAFPAVVAGSIFTFSLTLGDYITPQLVSNSQFIGNVIYEQPGRRRQHPVRGRVRARSRSLIMALYLLVARRIGAFDAL